MATCNGGRFLKEQLDSLAAQQLQPFELQIGDDQSTDDTIQIIEAFAARAPFPLTLHRNASRLGYGENFIATARRCRGDWIAFCDQDDVWLPAKLAVCARAISRASADVQLVVHNGTITDEELRPRQRLYDWPSDELLPWGSLPPDWVCPGLLQLFRADLVHCITSNERPSLPGHPWTGPHDLWICVLGGALGPVLRLSEPLVHYRRHGETVTQIAGHWPERHLLADNSAEYAVRAEFLAQLAALLGRAENTLDERRADRLRNSIERIAKLADHLGQRVEIYRANKVEDRLRLLARLVLRGAYLSSRPDAFGVRSLARDAMATIMPRQRDRDG
jgi:glycosyltransferase involved in cell wall biosynthesis